MAYTQIIRKQIIKSDINTLWNFISSPENLEKITPKWMSFKITSKSLSKKMYAGMIISYIVKPVFNIPMKWITEITHVQEKEYFVDEQRLGPYKMWHHEHKLEKTKEGILMTDIITYIPPFGVFGRIINYFFIKKRVNKIFDYRYSVLDNKFNK
tara:strand:+ start:169 stop:630 length:462 start_codon:yes stop_codon:yes gene_type:complete